MTFPTLLISNDTAAAVLTPVLSSLGSTVLRCSQGEAVKRLTRERFSAVVVDFEDSLPAPPTFPSLQPASAGSILRQAQEGIPGHRAIAIALLNSPAKVRDAIAAGANFILYQPISAAQAKTSLRAAAALIMHDRRRTHRVPVQVPVHLKAGGDKAMEGILLDLSCEGLDVLVPQPMAPATAIHMSFTLPAVGTVIDADGDVAWANPNGETGVRFLELAEEARQKMQEWLDSNQRELPALEPEEYIEGALTDLSLGACYVETGSPFPEQSGVTLCLKAEDIQAEAEGVVRVMHPGFGMGVEFVRKTMEDSAQVANFIGFLRACPGTAPELSIRPRDPVADTATSGAQEDFLFFVEMDDPLLDLLHRQEHLSQEQFLQELHSQRTGAEVAAG